MKLIQLFKPKKTAAPVVLSAPEMFPSRDSRTIAVVKPEPADFTARFGLVFWYYIEDGLGPTCFSTFKSEGIGQVMLLRQDSLAELGTEILVDSRQDFRRSLEILMAQLHLEPDDIRWTIFEAEHGGET